VIWVKYLNVIEFTSYERQLVTSVHPLLTAPSYVIASIKLCTRSLTQMLLGQVYLDIVSSISRPTSLKLVIKRSFACSFLYCNFLLEYLLGGLTSSCTFVFVIFDVAQYKTLLCTSTTTCEVHLLYFFLRPTLLMALTYPC
jgi:hypothetical protein